MMNKILKEPLLHFLLLGIILYMASVLFSKEEQQGNILVTEGKIKQLTTLYKKTWQRSPTSEELNEIVQEYVLEQAAYREGVNLGLDKNDIVITRRVRQKLDFIAEENQERPEPTDNILTAYLEKNGEKFRREPTLSFKQIYLDPKHYDNVSIEANRLLINLQQSPNQDVTKLGERYLFKASYRQKNITKLQSTFGKEFTQRLENTQVGTWFGPVKSSFGLHLVYLDEKEAGKLPELAQIRSTVVREWENQLRNNSIEHYYDELLQRFDVIIQWPENKAPLLSNNNRK